jgi:fatty-acid desaturase
MMCEALSGYICKMELYASERQKLEETVLSLLGRNLGNNHHNYQENFYNTVR